MCGRYAITLLPEAMARLLGADWKDGAVPNLAPSWNVAPTTQCPVAANGRDGRTLLIMRWGLIPFFTRDSRKLPLMINARSETVREKPSFRTLWAKRRRCLVPADGFFEWTPKDEAKQPYFFRRKDGEPMVMGGLWDQWKGPDGDVLSFCIISTGANETMKPVHHRSPLILERDDRDRWLAEDDPANLLAPPRDGMIEYYPVNKRVNAVRNDDETLVGRVG